MPRRRLSEHGFDFLDSSLWLHFRMDGTVDQEASYQALVHAGSGRKVVIPGFYGVLPDGSIHTFSPVSYTHLPRLWAADFKKMKGEHHHYDC